MAVSSAGILLYRKNADTLEVFLVHPGGPLYAKRDEGVWSIPKGEFGVSEDPLDAAKREFEEETGSPIDGVAEELGSVVMKNRKNILAWAVEGDLDPATLKSNFFEMEWPPRTGKKQQFPEVDRGEWFTFETAKQKIHPSQLLFLERLNGVRS